MRSAAIISLLFFVCSAAGQEFHLSYNDSFNNDLEKILDNYTYTKEFKLDDFDCADTCMIVLTVLQANGYHPLLIINTEKDHGWIAVPDESGNLSIVETVSEQGLGKIVTGSPDYLYGMAVRDPWAFMDDWGIGQRVRANLQSYRPI
jgi:hypothetical protein